jgi:hypothetical protein
LTDGERPVDEFTDEDGVRWLVLGHDPGGERTEQLRRKYASRWGRFRFWWRRRRGLPQMLEFRGGPANGLREPAPPEDGLHPQLYRIDTEDAGYARTAEQHVGDDGVKRTVFRVDPDGTLTKTAQRLYSGAPD